jgi:hypothetical protein
LSRDQAAHALVRFGVTPAMCGVSSRLGQPSKCGLAASGSASNTSSAAPPSRPSRSASATAAIVDDAAARGVDQHRAAFHRRDARGVEQVARAIDQRHVQAHHVGLRHQFIEAERLRAGLREGRVARVQHRVEGHGAHAQRPRELRRQLADGAETDQPERLARQLAPVAKRARGHGRRPLRRWRQRRRAAAAWRWRSRIRPR